MKSDENGASVWACVATAALMLIGLVRLGVCLYDVQVEGSAAYAYNGDRQSIRRVQIPGLRGRILDRKGAYLAVNRSIATIACNVAFYQKRNWEDTTLAVECAITNVAAVVGLPVGITRESIRRHVMQERPYALVVWKDIGERELARFEEHAYMLPGFMIVEGSARVYPQGTLGAHLLGYVGEPARSREDSNEKFSHYLPELRGRAGLEHYYDDYLRGVAGERRVRVDARCFATQEWTVSEPQNGPDLRLTIDSGVQQVAEEQLRGLKGACVVVDPRDGAVLALASAPSFDPNLARWMSHDAEYRADPAMPYLNRASGGAYAPGSTFKPIVALAALASGMSANYSYACNGLFEMGPYQLHCASRWGHGTLDMTHALMRSCNPYFCNLGMTIGTNVIITTAHAFGLGERTGLDLNGEQPGVVPDASWKMRTYGEKWYLGDLVQMSIGQGMLLVSPLQMALVTGAIGTGYRVTPKLRADAKSSCKALPYSKAQLDVVRHGMRLVVAGDDDVRGTGWRGGEQVPVAVSGKTGTAEIGAGERRRKNTWFIAYAPSENPRVAVAMVIENGESGGGTTAPRVAAVLRKVFEGG